jgi:hypothetical protein
MMAEAPSNPAIFDFAATPGLAGRNHIRHHIGGGLSDRRLAMVALVHLYLDGVDSIIYAVFPILKKFQLRLLRSQGVHSDGFPGWTLDR